MLRNKLTRFEPICAHIFSLILNKNDSLTIPFYGIQTFIGEQKWPIARSLKKC